ncbi:hypothetical protein K439DRAFT_1620303 [Ramaria rubella]|nr:hypothetical protein K439DRAFT_1620303 [Ramaria rubella]
MAFTYVTVAAFAYDTLLTFPFEIRHYPVHIGSLPYTASTSGKCLWEFCNLSLITGLLFARAYAISSHKKLVFMMLTLLGTITIVLSIVGTAINKCITLSNSAVLCKTFNSICQNRVHTVFISIFENTLGLLQLQSGIPGLQRNTLAKLLVQQGSTSFSFITREIKRHSRFVLTITIADTVTDKVLRATLQAILDPFQNSLAIILICRFHLDLQQRNDHPNGSNTSHSLPLGSFHAVKERIHRAVVDEFGDLSFNESFGTEGFQEDIELQAIQSPSGVAEIDLEEFPWAGGYMGDEEAGPVASGSGILRE